MYRVKESLKKAPLLKEETVKSAKAKYQKARMIFMTIYSVFAYAMPVFASEPDAGTSIGNLLGVVASIFRYVGIALFAWGAIQFILATKRSDGDSKADAIQTAMCGIALMLIKTILEALGLGVDIKDVAI